MSIIYELKRLIKNKPEYVVTFTHDEMEMIYDALNELEYNVLVYRCFLISESYIIQGAPLLL